MKNFIVILILICILILSSCSQADEASVYQDSAYLPLTTGDESADINNDHFSPEPELTPNPVSEPTASPTPEPTPLPTPEPVVIDYEAVKPNEVGLIMVIMYHQIVQEEKNAYQRSIEGFKSDLQRLYDGGFRTISMSDLINNNINIEAGMTPVVLTFDDGYSTAFSLANIDGTLKPAENCAVDILNNFAQENPDFGNSAIFYINSKTEPFKGAGTLEERFSYLIDNGYEIGNHTYSHERLGTLDAESIQEQIGIVHNLLLDTIGYEMTSMAYPYGQRPAEDFRSLALKGEYNGISYNYHSGARVGQTGDSAAPNNVKFNSYNIPRVQGSDLESTDLGWFLRKYEEGSNDRYISDGLPDRISVPESKKESVNLESIGDKELFFY